MLTKEEIRFRAVKMGIATGDMPNVELVWTIQKMEDHDQCFGQGRDCTQKDCRWRTRCRALDLFTDTPLGRPAKHKRSA